MAASVIAGLTLVPAAAAPQEPTDILAFGDSLVAGYGLDREEAFPAQLEAALKADGHDVVVRNAGVSGDTTAAARDRLSWVLNDPPDAAIIVLGGNDALRGVDPARTRENLAAILRAFRERDVPVLLAGMRAPPSMGEAYQQSFDAIFPALAERFDCVFYPFFLKDVAARPALNQSDGIHPTAEGVSIIVDRMRPRVEDLLARARR